MDLMSSAEQGFATVQVDDASKQQALVYVRQWLTAPEFAPYRPQIEWLIATKQWSGLIDRFYQILPFGTGGRRGAVGIGPNRMNLWTLGASVQGHCEYLKERFPGVTPLTVGLAYDVRKFEDRRKCYNPDLANPVLHLSSRDLAHYAAGVYAANGIYSYCLPAESNRYLATPELSFLIRYYGAQGGLNISASHNPPDDNGGKFYDERGGQPVAPDDQIMADLVDRVQTIRSISWAEAMRTGKIKLLDDTSHKAYLDVIRHESLVPPPRFDEIRVVFTPLHGVGGMTAMEALVNQGFRVTPVPEQMTPDGQFPNVTKTPNPEIPESMDRAARVALETEGDLVLATDPDADRIGAMIKDGKGGCRYVNGNEIAALLTHFKLNKLQQQGRLPRSPIVVRTEVTTGQITRIARHFSAQIVDNLLVGFKYIAEVLWSLERTGAYEDVRGKPEDFIIATEESHGVLITHRFRDKDAAGAALLLAELALDQKRQGKTVVDYIDSLNRQFGYYRNVGVPVFMTGIQGKQDMVRMIDGLRASPIKEIGGLKVTGFEDLRDERGRMGPMKGATDFAARNFLIFRMGDRAKVVLRPSGTEPKAKTYVEACTPPCAPGTTTDAWQRACGETDQLVDKISADFLKKSLALIGLEPSAAGVR